MRQPVLPSVGTYQLYPLPVTTQLAQDEYLPVSSAARNLAHMEKNAPESRSTGAELHRLNGPAIACFDDADLQ
ncbi:MAG: hypothetical protein WC972_07745 [Trueperaceae bacterium]